jgi:hypothetical protein
MACISMFLIFNVNVIFLLFLSFYRAIYWLLLTLVFLFFEIFLRVMYLGFLTLLFLLAIY